MSYFTKTMDSIKKKISEQGKKKLIEKTVIVIIIGMIILIAGSSLFSKGSTNTNKATNNKVSGGNVETSSRNTDKSVKGDLEIRLESILSKIEGVGKVDVMVTYISGKELVPAYNIRNDESSTVEKDNQGGTRNINESSKEENIAYEEEQGVKKPIIIKDIEPVVKGVIVVADGANNPSVHEKILKAVQVLTDLPIHKIQVFERNGQDK